MKKFLVEFKEFISRGNVIDMAVGIIIGGAFTAIVTSLVDDIIMPVLSIVTGGLDFSALKIVIGTGEDAASFKYGAFLSAVINFVIIAFVIFCMIKAMNKFRKSKDEEPTPDTKECPYCKEKIAIAATRCPHCTSEIK